MPRAPIHTPTAGEEALQAPAIDPINLLSMIPTFGLGAAVGNGLQQGLYAHIMGHPAMGAGLPGGPPMSIASDMTKRAATGADALGEDGFLQPSHYGQFMRNLFGYLMGNEP